jgi:hypothetical protein
MTEQRHTIGGHVNTKAKNVFGHESHAQRRYGTTWKTTMINGVERRTKALNVVSVKNGWVPRAGCPLYPLVPPIASNPTSRGPTPRNDCGSSSRAPSRTAFHKLSRKPMHPHLLLLQHTSVVQKMTPQMTARTITLRYFS